MSTTAKEKRKPRRGVLTPLSQAEQDVAQSNHWIVEIFLLTQKLYPGDWYDVVIFRYLLTVKNWFRRPDLYKYEFSTIAWNAMRSAVYNERRKQRLGLQTVSLDDPIPGTDGLTWGDTITEENLIYAREVS